MNDYGVVLFHTTSSAMRAEKTLLRHGLTIKMIPTPRQFSSDCGIALRFDWSQRDAVREFLAGALVEVAGLHRLA
jgi:hypothetical protein